MKTHKLKVTLNEIKRMQELAGILKEGSSYQYVSSKMDNDIDLEDQIIDLIKHYNLGSGRPGGNNADWGGTVWSIQDPNIYLYLGDDELVVVKREIVDEDKYDDTIIASITSDEELEDILKKAKSNKLK
jgi:hypothetical protein